MIKWIQLFTDITGSHVLKKEKDLWRHNNGPQVRAPVSLPAAAPSLCCSSVLPFSVCIYFDLKETRWCQKKLHFSHNFYAGFFFSFLSSDSSLAVQQPHFFSTKYLWLKASSATMGRQSRARCTRYHKVEPQQPSSFWVSPWKALRIKHIFSLTFTCCWALIHKIVFSLVVNMG